MGWKHISTLYPISVTPREVVGECINGDKDPKRRYVKSVTTGMARPLSNGNDYVDMEN